MAKRQHRPKPLASQIGIKADRKQRTRSHPKRGLWFGLGMFGLVGWSVTVPTLLGIAVGVWMDKQWPGRISWTLTLLFLGVVLGCRNAWYWIEREQQHNDHDK